MKYYIKFLFIFALSISLFIGCISVKKPALKEPVKEKPLVEEEPIKKPIEGLVVLPDFELQDIHKRTYSLLSYRDKQNVILLFWTTWCPFCQEQLVSINKKYPELKKNGLELLAINVEESIVKVERFVKLHNLPFPILLDQHSSVANAFGVMGVPTYFIIDKKGKIIAERHDFPEKEYRDLISK